MPRTDAELTWPIRDRRDVSQHYVFDVREHQGAHPVSGRERTFTTLRCSTWVNVLALTPHDDVLFVRQFRHGTETVTTELPGGMVDPGEDPIAAGMRELREETGYTASQWLWLGDVEPNPAMQDNRCALILALDAVPSGPLELDDGEDIEVMTMPLSRCPAAVFDGTITHSLVVCTFFAFREKVGGWHRPDADQVRQMMTGGPR